MAPSKVRVKLLIDTKGKKVLFAEAGKDFVDFLFYLLSLPLGSVVKLLREESMCGCLSNLYESIENLNETYVHENQNKNSVLNPTSQLRVTGIPLLLSDHHESTTREFYTCPNSYGGGHRHMSDVKNMTCPSCQAKMTHVWSYVSPTAASAGTVAEGGGFVKGVVTYTIMDNLEVTPMSTISSLTLLNKFKVKDVAVLEEKVVNLGVDEVLKLLKASLECKTVLTTVFLGN
ncbi:hypothetical protein WN944_018330 [Citrus x changshan-huyou]|uniref:DUF674 domain-containing protein n=1 Tax=Citrus x changshan-huyou TaxID=2935761 RepID=A0AAP0LUJ8_9ROSI